MLYGCKWEVSLGHYVTCDALFGRYWHKTSKSCKKNALYHCKMLIVLYNDVTFFYFDLSKKYSFRETVEYFLILIYVFSVI